MAKMLGRTASGLFWMMRYLERFENTARLIDAGFRMSLTRVRTPAGEWESVLTTAGTRDAYLQNHDGFRTREVIDFVRLADYNQWFNQALYNAAERLSEFDYRKDAGAFFNSVHGTLNHIMVWDVTWLKRFRTHTIKYPSLDRIETYTTPTSHDEILFDEHQQLRQARIDIDQIIKDFVTETREADYETVFSYTISTGETFNKNFGGMVQHLFNHQTHHRGQVTVLMSQMGIDPGVTDLLARLPEEKHNESNTL